MQLDIYLALARRSEQTLAGSFRVVGDGHARQPDVLFTCRMLAELSDRHVAELEPAISRYGKHGHDAGAKPERLHVTGLTQVRSGQMGLLRDLQDLHVLSHLVRTTWTVVIQAAQGLRDRELLRVAQEANTGTSRQLAWLNTRMKAAAPQALLVAGERGTEEEKHTR